MTDQPDQHPGLQDLVLDAFRMAARRGKPEWHRMAGTVLKNRLLDLTERSFDEADYGADRFGDLVEQLDDLLTVDHSAKPYLIELREPYRSEIQQSDAASASSSAKTIRSDLWHAIVDYSSGQKWVWDPRAGKAVLAQEIIEPGEDELPTLDRSTHQSWRAEFAEEHLAGVADEEALKVQLWASKGLGTSALPAQLRGPWNIWMGDRVHERLLGFFQSRGLEPPKDVLIPRKRPKPADALRKYIVQCVALMSERELKELRIPAEIAMRLRR